MTSGPRLSPNNKGSSNPFRSRSWNRHWYRLPKNEQGTLGVGYLYSSVTVSLFNRTTSHRRNTRVRSPGRTTNRHPRPSSVPSVKPEKRYPTDTVRPLHSFQDSEKQRRGWSTVVTDYGDVTVTVYPTVNGDT